MVNCHAKSFSVLMFLLHLRSANDCSVVVSAPPISVPASPAPRDTVLVAEVVAMEPVPVPAGSSTWNSTLVA